MSQKHSVTYEVLSAVFLKGSVFGDVTMCRQTSSSQQCRECGDITRVVPKVMSNFFLHANWEKQTKERAVVDGTSCCVILECLVMSIVCIT